MSTTTYSVTCGDREYRDLALEDALVIASGMIGCPAYIVRDLFDSKLAATGEASRGANPHGGFPTGTMVTVRAHGPHVEAPPRRTVPVPPAWALR